MEKLTFYKYKADDGTFFDTETECLEYERKFKFTKHMKELSFISYNKNAFGYSDPTDVLYYIKIYLNPMFDVRVQYTKADIDGYTTYIFDGPIKEFLKTYFNDIPMNSSAYNKLRDAYYNLLSEEYEKE